MYKITEISTYLDDCSVTLTGRVGEGADDINLSIDCQELCPTKDELLAIRKWLNAVIKEAK